MMANLNKTGGLIFSQNLLIALVSKGVLREDAYKWVQRNAMARWLEGADFKTNVEMDAEYPKISLQRRNRSLLRIPNPCCVM
mgnify:FL=1